MNDSTIKFALNHMACPALSPLQLIDAAVELGMEAVELRNDVRENSLNDLETARAVALRAGERGIRVLSVNALYPFNMWDAERAEQAERLAELASAAGAEGLVCCPLVSADYRATLEEKNLALRAALEGLQPILEKHRLHGFIEPLGFPISSLRFKRQAVDAIRELGAEDRFGLVHDTFHHTGASETEFFPQMTGLVHISGVEDPDVSFSDMLDAHRVFVGPKDRLDSVGQIRQLRAAGYRGFVSFEPFFDELWEMRDPLQAIYESMQFIRGELATAHSDS